MLERPIEGKDSGSRLLWPTPQASDWKNMDTAKQKMLSSEAKKFPTPAARDWKDGNHPAERARNTPPLAVHAGGQLNPNWVEWLIGWPIGWTDLKPLAMGKYQQWLRQHGRY